MKNSLLIIIFFLTAFANLLAQETKTIETGNTFYRQQLYDKAEAEYRKALETSQTNQIIKFNLANALIRQNKIDEANKLLAELTMNETPADLRAKAFYNEGVLFSRQKKLEESIESYKNVLRLNPTDQQARENLQKALLELKKKNPPKKEDQKKKEEPKKQKQPPKPKITPKQAQQQLKLLEQKEKQVQERLQKSSKTGNALPKDW